MTYALRRLPDRAIVCWAAIGVAALAAAVACTRPMFEIGIGAYIGGGDEQRGFDYDRILTPLTRPAAVVGRHAGHRAHPPRDERRGADLGQSADPRVRGLRRSRCCHWERR